MRHVQGFLLPVPSKEGPADWLSITLSPKCEEGRGLGKHARLTCGIAQHLGRASGRNIWTPDLYVVRLFLVGEGDHSVSSSGLHTAIERGKRADSPGWPCPSSWGSPCGSVSYDVQVASREQCYVFAFGALSHL